MIAVKTDRVARFDKLNGLSPLQRQSWGRNALIVALTGWGQEHDRRRAESAGFDRHPVKPIGEEALRTLLEDASPAAESAPAAA